MASTIKVSNYIPEDVYFCILSKLPLKTLKRFTCIRRSCALLLENPHFISVFCNNFISKHHSFYDDTFLLLKQTMPSYDHHCALYLLSGERFENKVKLDWPTPFQEDDTLINILGSGINGTFCLYKVNHTTVVLWNPTIKEFKFIPHNPTEYLPNWTDIVTLHGFGYDHVRDDYKVIRHVDIIPIVTRIEHDWADMPTRPDALWEMYSLRSNSWRKLDVNMPPRDIIGKGGDYMNGLCHWLGKTNDETYVVSFNLSNEVFLTTPLPSDMYDGFHPEWVDKCLVVLNMSIAMISNYAKKTSFHISVLGELGVKESWTTLFIVGPLPFVEHPIGAGKKKGYILKERR